MTPSKRICCIDKCGKRVYARNWCAMHYRRWRVNGEPGGPTLTPEQRFWAKVNKTETCWLWTAYTSPDGYGRFQYATGDGRLAHRLAWELLVGPIADGLVLDHLCRNRICVRPDHLELVTLYENIERGITGSFNRSKTECPQGHPYDTANTYVARDGKRYCRKCRYERKQRRRRAAREASRS